MSAAALMAFIGRRVEVECFPGLFAVFVVADARTNYGEVQVKLEPVSGGPGGHGSAWVKWTRCKAQGVS